MDAPTQPMLFIFGERRAPEFTVREYAAIERVTERTVYTWIRKGAIDVRRTPGGGIRISSDMKSTEDVGSSSR